MGKGGELYWVIGIGTFLTAQRMGDSIVFKVRSWYNFSGGRGEGDAGESDHGKKGERSRRLWRGMRIWGARRRLSFIRQGEIWMGLKALDALRVYRWVGKWQRHKKGFRADR